MTKEEHCPNCKYHKKRAQLWRDEAYKWAGHELPREPEQDKPVAYGMRDTMIGAGNRMMYVRLDKGQDGCTVPLYTKPQAKEWVSLTDEEIFEVENSVPDEVITDYDWCIYFAKAIETKLKERNT